MTGQLDALSWRGLSCYTANLAGYLAAEWDARSLLARSVRLAVRLDRLTGTLAFSHHAPALDRLPDGTRLRYAPAESPAAALAALAEELAGFARALAVVDTARLPWSPAYGGESAPHWLLIDGREGGRWHVADLFSGLLPAGEQRPHAGWMDSRQLRDAVTLPARWRPEQDVRNSLAFGDPVPVPAEPGALTLHRFAADAADGAGPGEGWLVGDRDALPFLADFLAAQGAAAVRYREDVWAVAGHRAFVYRWRLATTGGRPEADRRALAQWERLPRLLHIALESALRRRPRPTLVRSAFQELLRVEGLA
ncbi:MAG TPA: hypothetical protein VOB72_23710 [Candidatus Dormibacteraeota bacterium]|nr:hypothetical protein [Candidatus Dormibacteraeota bacterium]